MRTTWETVKPQQTENGWLASGNMEDEDGNRFHIVVTAPTFPESNVLALEKFMKLQMTERYRQFDILFDDSATRSGHQGLLAELVADVQLEKLSITVTPTNLVTNQVYMLQLADTIEDERAGPGVYPFAVTTTDLFARCNVTRGEVEMIVTNELGTYAEAQTIMGGQQARIDPERTTDAIRWDVTLHLKSDKNVLSYNITGPGKRSIQ